jgi:type III secretion protein T
MAELLSGPLAFVELGMSTKSFLMMLALCSARFFVLTLIFPPTGDTGLTGSVRNGMVLLMGFFIAWGQPLQIVQGLDTLQLAMLIVKEGVLGMVLGFAGGIVFWVAEGVGGLIDNQAGFNNVQQTNPAGGHECTPIGNVMSQLSHACFWILGGMTTLVGVMFESYQWWPLTRLAPDWSGVLLAFAQTQSSSLMRLMITLAAPTLLVLLLIDLGFGLLGKTAEKLEPNSLSQPVKGVVSLLMMALLVAMFFHEARPQMALQTLSKQIVGWLDDAKRAR